MKDWIIFYISGNFLTLWINIFHHFQRKANFDLSTYPSYSMKIQFSDSKRPFLCKVIVGTMSDYTNNVSKSHYTASYSTQNPTRKFLEWLMFFNIFVTKFDVGRMTGKIQFSDEFQRKTFQLRTFYCNWFFIHNFC